MREKRQVATVRTTTATAIEDGPWSCASPWTGLEQLARPDGRALPPRDGDVWRMDFSRFNQYKEARPGDDPGGWAWSPHGVWDSHVPEVFPYVTFSRGPAEIRLTFTGTR